MKSSATGLSVRLFKVTTPIGRLATGKSTGNTLISGRLVGKLNADVGKIVRNVPCQGGSSALSEGVPTTVARG